MAWIETTPEDSAGDELAGIYSRARDPRSGRVDNILAVHSLHPTGLEAHLGLYTAVMRGTPGLPAVDRELVAWAVSRTNGCHY